MPRTPAARPTRWRVGVPLALAGAGVLLATSYAGSGGTDLRPGERRTDLASLVSESGDRVEAARDRVADLRRTVDRLSARAAAGGPAPGGAPQGRLGRLREEAGLTPVAGPGLTVVLDDAPDRVIDQVAEDGPVTVSDLVVHQQDIQAVANALWAGGAEAMTIRGQRVVATTGIKCVGNTVILHGVPYSPPYDIAAVGDPAVLRTALEDSSYVGLYREVADAYGLGYVVLPERELRVPGYSGTTEVRHAEPVPG